MRVRPRKHWDDELKVIPADANYLVLECEVDHPKSTKGRTVYVIFEGDEVTKLLLEARHVAIRARSKPLNSC